MRNGLDIPSYYCARIDESIMIDGRVDKPVWQAIEAHALQPTTDDGAETTDVYQATTFRACWSDLYLYLAFECDDRDIWGTYARRDDPLYEEEVVEAFLAPTGDAHHYYEFEVSPRNVLFDAKVRSPDLNRRTMTVDTAWDCAGLVSAVQIRGTLRTTPPQTRTPGRPTVEGEGWSVEIAIPFAAFPEAGAPKPGDRWRANFYRIDRTDPPEFTAWSPTLEIPANFHVPERFGWLEFTE